MKKCKKVLVALVLLVSMPMLLGCGKISSTSMHDFFGEYRFELPFEAEGHFAGKVFFRTDYTLDEQRQLIEKADYNATIYDFEGIRRIFIVATTENYRHYFIIWEEEDDLFILDNHSAFVGPNIIHENVSGNILFPVHIASLEPSEEIKSNSIKVFKDFEYIQNYFEGTKRNDIVVNNSDVKTIKFSNKQMIHNENDDPYDVQLILQFVEKSNGYFIVISIS